MSPPVLDTRHRPLRDLRISVTDRCNFRCRYCMPREHFGPGHRYLERTDLLTFDEIARLAGLFASLGVRKVRLTGGEPMLRGGVERLVERLSGMSGIDLAMADSWSHRIHHYGVQYGIPLDGTSPEVARPRHDVRQPSSSGGGIA